MTQIGTPFYMAPEIGTEEAYDEKVDCFAWGKTGLKCHKICGFIDGYYISKVTEDQMSKSFSVAIKNALIEDPEERSSSKKILDDLGIGVRKGGGKKEFSDGKVYVGNFRRCRMNGPGRLTWPDGTYYEGPFKNDMMSGEGVMCWPDGRKYTGRFENNKMNGLGELSWPDRPYDYSENVPLERNSGYGWVLELQK